MPAAYDETVVVERLAIQDLWAIAETDPDRRKKSAVVRMDQTLKLLRSLMIQPHKTNPVNMSVRATSRGVSQITNGP